MPGMQDVVNQLARKAAEDQKKQLIDALATIYKGMYDSAANYTNIIMLAGYAGGFALWSLVGDVLSKEQRSWAGLWLLISLAVFVLWEVTKMILLGVIAIRFQKLSAVAPMQIQTHMQTYGDSEHRMMMRVHWAWAVFVLPTAIGSALAGIGVLTHAFVTTILF